MPHQCLKCGSVFADGSPEILRGCPGCGGTRFFFTEKRMSDDERSKLQEQANKDIKHFIQEMLTSEDISVDIKHGKPKKEEWVQFIVVDDEESGPKKKKVELSGPVTVRDDMVKSIEDLVFPKEGKTKKFKFKAKAEVPKPKEEATKVTKPTAEEIPAPIPAPPPMPEVVKEDTVAVISIDEEGVYDIDVEKLLEKSPIIVQKDGSYVVHLPSVFKRRKKKGATS
jgi:predicted  nucleic acid-binding Zn-ribbon protein